MTIALSNALDEALLINNFLGRVEIDEFDSVTYHREFPIIEGHDLRAGEAILILDRPAMKRPLSEAAKAELRTLANAYFESLK